MTPPGAGIMTRLIRPETITDLPTILVCLAISHARNSALLLRWNWRSSSERRWSDERTKATPALHPSGGSAPPSADRPQRLLTLVAGPTGSHRAGQRPRRADQHHRLSGAVR